MSRRRKDQLNASSDAELVQDALEDEFLDDELARELEEERQAILAASANGHASSKHSEAEVLSSGVEGDDANSILDEDEDDLDPQDIPDQDDSEDEWQPPEPASSRPTRQSKRRRRQASSEDSDDDVNQVLSDDQVEPAPKKSKMKAGKPAKTNKEDGRSQKAKTAAAQASMENGANEKQEEEYDSFDEEAERVQAEVEAAAAWADVRRRKEAASNPDAPSTSASSSSSTAAPSSLTAWLGKPPIAASSTSELSSSLPMPTTCTAAQITDRSSLFIGYVYPLLTASSAYISALLSHLTRVVHPTVPVTILPPQFANAPSSKRGASHDMYAYRVFELKRGRTGLSGPDDFSLQEEKEDDGERWGGDRVLRVARDEGASDVLVVVSRWYGGELLGPVRFDHIENAARAAVQEHMQKMEVEEFRLRIQHLDRKINVVKAKLQSGEEEARVGDKVNAYEGLTVEKGQRLWLARQKTLDALQRRIASQPSQSEASQPQEAVADAEPASTAAEPTTSPSEAAAPTPTEVEGPSAHEPAVKAEPLEASIPETVAEDPSEPTPPIKPEPTLPTLTSPSAPTTIVKAEPESIFLLTNDNESEDEKSNVVKLEPIEENNDDDAEDLTGWDDLS